MKARPEIDDAATDALLAGAGHDIDPALARLLDVIRESYAVTPPDLRAELACIVGGFGPV